MARITDIKYLDWESWQELWEADKRNMLATMYRNLTADLDCGYDPLGKSIQTQKEMIAQYERGIHEAWDKFVSMTEAEVERWCFYDMKKRGVIA